MPKVSFDIDKSELPHIKVIVDRIAKIHRENGRGFSSDDRLSCRMDLIATHANGCPMNFAKLASGDDFNLMHDVFGIERHIDRTTGKLTSWFLPRCALPEAAAA